MTGRSTGGKALCETRGDTLEEMCCQGVELKCFGCNNKLLNKFGIVSIVVKFYYKCLMIMQSNAFESHVMSNRHQLTVLLTN